MVLSSGRISVINPQWHKRVTHQIVIVHVFQASFSIHIEDDDVSAGDIRAEVEGPDSRHTVHFNWVARTGEGYFTPTETGLHKVWI